MSWCYGMETGSLTRDWNEEHQSCRELPMANRQGTATRCNTMQHTASRERTYLARAYYLHNSLQRTAIHCNILQHAAITASYRNTPQHTATYCSTDANAFCASERCSKSHCDAMVHIVTQCKSLQYFQHSTTQIIAGPNACCASATYSKSHSIHVARHCMILQHTVTHCHRLQHHHRREHTMFKSHCNTLPYTATHCNVLQGGVES